MNNCLIFLDYKYKFPDRNITIFPNWWYTSGYVLWKTYFFVILINNNSYNEAVFQRKNFEKFIEFSRSLLKPVPIRSLLLYTLVRDGVALNQNGDWLPMLTKIRYKCIRYVFENCRGTNQNKFQLQQTSVTFFSYFKILSSSGL